MRALPHAITLIGLCIPHISSFSPPHHYRSRPSVDSRSSSAILRVAAATPSEDAASLDAEPATATANQEQQLLRHHHPLFTRPQQLWLDLRRTAVLPDEAIEILQSQLEDVATSATGSFVDGVLVAPSVLERIQQHSTSNPTTEQGFFILSVMEDDDASDGATTNNDNNQLVLVEIDQQQPASTATTPSYSVRVGTAVVTNSDTTNTASFDPQLALQTVVDEQNWLLLSEADTTSASDDVTHLLQLLASAPTLEAANPGELLLPRSTSAAVRDATVAHDSGDTTTTGGGGVAIPCRDIHSFLALEATVQALQYGGPTTTDAGLLLLPTTTANNTARRLPHTAVVLPLDLSLWKSVLEMRGMGQEEEY